MVASVALFEFPVFADQPSMNELMQIADLLNLVAGGSVDAVSEGKPSLRHHK